MAFVFYDTETSGVSTDFDQILQFAAILTDEELVERDRLEVRCRLHAHVVPHPGALRVTGMTLERLLDPALPCHYDMVRTIRAKLIEWSPAVFIGYNSMRFDEQLLRQALFRTLHSPYLTNTGGNCRADAMALVHAARAFSPGCVEVPIGDHGRPVFRLDRLAPANGFEHANAHDALADVEATIHLARCIRDNAPESWSRFLRFATKAAAVAFLEEEDAIVLSEFYFNNPYHFVVTALGPNPSNPSAMLALNLRFDVEWVAGLSHSDLRRWIASTAKPIRQVRTNTAPCLAAADEVPAHLLGSMNLATAYDRAARVRSDEALRSRLVDAFADVAPTYDESPHVEEQIYSAFSSTADQARMDAFHAADWPTRVHLVEQFEDARLRYHGRRLVFELHPELLAAEHRKEVEEHMWERLLMAGAPQGKWTSIPDALAAAEAMMSDCDEAGREMLEAYRRHFEIVLASRRTG